jgi:hypothetical protein
MRFFRRLRDRLMAPPIPDKCPACRDTSGLISASGGLWFHCDCCGKDFTAWLDPDGSWRSDTTPARHRQRLSA